jgi:hypothetical protein
MSKYDYQTSGKSSLNLMNEIFALAKPAYLQNHKLIYNAIKKIENDL